MSDNPEVVYSVTVQREGAAPYVALISSAYARREGQWKLVRHQQSRQEGHVMDIRLDDLSGPEIAELLQEHLRDMHRVSPPESIHALDLESLRKPDITFWTIWDAGLLAGCGALKELDPQHAEIKSMRTASVHRRKGVAKRMLQHILSEAKQRGYTRLSLETGSMDFFLPARALYASFGFTMCPPFAEYVADPNSVFMTREL